MNYQLERNETVEDGIKRIAFEKVDRAITHVTDEELSRHETVHEVRKRCKEIRAGLRLVRPALGETYSNENAWYRDTARKLSDIRDAEAFIETYDEHITPFAEGVLDETTHESVRERLVERRDRIAREQDLDGRLEDVLDDLREGRSRIELWTLDADGFDAIGPGVKKSYRRGRSAMETAYDDPTTEHFHEWRKRAKYHRYHTRLLRNVWSSPMKTRRSELKKLTDQLGDEHDLAVFREILDAEDFKLDTESRNALFGLIARRRAELQATSNPLGARVHAETPDALIGRLRVYWDAWKADSAGTGIPTDAA
jgi:CHAD domain-containing protein